MVLIVEAQEWICACLFYQFLLKICLKISLIKKKDRGQCEGEPTRPFQTGQFEQQKK